MHFTHYDPAMAIIQSNDESTSKNRHKTLVAMAELAITAADGSLEDKPEHSEVRVFYRDGHSYSHPWRSYLLS